jgi:hypothetical protein
MFSRKLKSRNRLSTQLRVERLEPRCMLAGVVIASVSPAGDLILAGDSLDNQIQITQSGADYTVTGLSGTQIQLGTDLAASQVLTGVTEDININMGAGNDSVLLDGTVADPVAAPRDLIVAMGIKGNESLALQTVDVGRDALLTMGSGNDALSVDTASIANNLVVIQGKGNYSTDLEGSMIGNNLVIVTPKGNELLTVIDTSVEGDANIVAGPGNAFVGMAGLAVTGDLHINFGPGNHYVVASLDAGAAGVVNSAAAAFTAANPIFTTDPILTPAATDQIADLAAAAAIDTTALTVGGGLEINMNHGSEFLDLSSASIGGNLNLHAGGSSVIAVANTDVSGHVGIVTGTGNDFIALKGLDVGLGLGIHAGGGNDVLSASITAAEIDAAMAAYAPAPTALLTALNAELDAIVPANSLSFKAKGAVVNTGPGKDVAYVSNAQVAGLLAINLGWGDDSLFFHDNTGRMALLLGGPGDNVLNTTGDNNVFDKLVVKRFP